MSKHTPDPWELLDAEGDKEYLRIRGTVLGGRYKIANVLWPNYSESAREREAAETLANAERIINCVNACAGMTDPAAEIAELKRQRDELLALAERLVQWDLDYPVNCYNGYAGLQALNAIIRDNKVAITKGSASLTKYQRQVPSTTIDIYDILKAWGVTCPATQHAIKKLLQPGERGHKDKLTDLREALASVERAIQMAEQSDPAFRGDEQWPS